MYTVIDLLRDQGIEKGIEKGRQEGRQEGLQQGLQQGRQEDIEKLLSKGILSPPEIASVLEVDRAWVEEIAKHIAGRK
jgi:predicted transposase YdaD